MEIFSFSLVIFYSAIFFLLSLIMYSRGYMKQESTFLLLRGWPIYGEMGTG